MIVILQEVHYADLDFTWSNRQCSTGVFWGLNRILMNEVALLAYPGVFYEFLSEDIFATALYY